MSRLAVEARKGVTVTYADRHGFEREYLTARLVELQEAVAALDAEPEPLRYHDARRRLVEMQVQVVAALASHSSDLSLN
jgi:hypothetical protein